jgi:hypothetical protein
VFVECLGWCLPFQHLAGSAIHGCGDGLEVVAVPPREIGAFREVLAERALVFSFVPRWTNMTAKRMKLPYCGGEDLLSLYARSGEKDIYYHRSG